MWGQTHSLPTRPNDKIPKPLIRKDSRSLVHKAETYAAPGHMPMQVVLSYTGSRNAKELWDYYSTVSIRARRYHRFTEHTGTAQHTSIISHANKRLNKRMQ